MNIKTDVRGVGTDGETATFPAALLGLSLLDPSSASTSTTEGEPGPARLEPSRSDTTDPRIRILHAATKTTFDNISSVDWLAEHVYVYKFRLLGENTGTAITHVPGSTGQKRAFKDKIADESKKAIEALTALADNWNGNGGRAPTAKAISAAKALVERLAPYLGDIPFFYPAAKGGIVAEMSAGSDRLTIILESNFLLGVSFIAGGHEMKEFDTIRGLTSEAVDWVNSRLAVLNRQKVST